jgi:hypothetical protein
MENYRQMKIVKAKEVIFCEFSISYKSYLQSSNSVYGSRSERRDSIPGLGS